MNVYTVAFLAYAVVCSFSIAALGWPWWSNAPFALAGVGAIALIARHRARARR